LVSKIEAYVDYAAIIQEFFF